MPVTVFSNTVTEYGAKPGNVEDCTAAIQAAIAACEASGGGVVYLPRGTYKVTSTLFITGDTVTICGAGKRATIIQFTPATNPDTLFLVEQAASPTQHFELMNIGLRAAADTTNQKIAIDIHDGRHVFMHNVEVQGWTGANSIALKTRGRDNGWFTHLHLTADYPVWIGKNDDYDSTKDLDHHWFEYCSLVATNSEKAVVKVEDAAVIRNMTWRCQAWVQGGFVCVDTTAPRRQSVKWTFEDIRIEGMSEGGSAAGFFAIDVQRHKNGKLRTLRVKNVLLAEQSDARYGETAGAAWYGIRALGVLRTRLDTVSYGGSGIPVLYDGELITTGCQLTPEDNGRAMPRHTSQWSILGITLGPRSWWLMDRASGADDEQDESLGPADYDLDPSGAVLPTQQQLVDGWTGYWIRLDENTNQKLRLNNTAAELDPATQPVAALAVFQFDTGWVPGGIREVLNLSGDATGPRLRVDTAGKLFLTCAGVDGAVSTNTYTDGQAFAVWLVINHASGGSVSCIVRKYDGTSETLSVAYSAAVGNNVNKGIGPYSVAVSSFKGYTRFAAWFLGSAAQQNGGTVLSNLRWSAAA